MSRSIDPGDGTAPPPKVTKAELGGVAEPVALAGKNIDVVVKIGTVPAWLDTLVTQASNPAPTVPPPAAPTDGAPGGAPGGAPAGAPGGAPAGAPGGAPGGAPKGAPGAGAVGGVPGGAAAPGTAPAGGVPTPPK
jgi:hypothetical protein